MSLVLILFPNAQPPNPPPANPLSLAGGTMSLTIPAPVAVSRADPDPSVVAMTIVAGNLPPVDQFAYYVGRPGVDFPTLGTYMLQAKFSAEGGILLQTSSFSFVVTDLSDQTTVLVLPFTRLRTGWPFWFRPKNAWG